jgi:hypothetical protein
MRELPPASPCGQPDVPRLARGAKDSNCSKVLSVDPHGIAVMFALCEYRAGHFDELAGGPSMHGWGCRRCGAKVSKAEVIHPFLYHLAGCVGVAPVIRDLEGIIRRFGTLKHC